MLDVTANEVEEHLEYLKSLTRDVNALIHDIDFNALDPLKDYIPRDIKHDIIPIHRKLKTVLNDIKSSERHFESVLLKLQKVKK